MKLRNLFLASLAAMAMVSCSNEVEGVDNSGNQLDENARMQFSIALPASSLSRATEDETGLATEQKVNSIQLILKYTDPNQQTSNKSLTFSDIEKEFTKEGSVYTLKAENAISAVAGEATVYVCINGTADASKVALAEGETVSAAYTNSLDGVASIATDNNFLMTGKNTVTIKDKETVTATVSVDRVAAKISERSAATNGSFVHETIFHQGNGANVTTETLKATFTLESYSFLNLNTTSYIFKQSNTFIPADGKGYFQYSAQDGTSKIDFEAANFYKKPIAQGAEVTYCMENAKDVAPTYVVYKAKVAIGDAADGVNFYTVKDANDNNRFYKNFADLKSAYKEVIEVAGLTDNSSYEDFFAAGIVKYTSGVCYYTKKINSTINGAQVPAIYRNNHYILTVNSITGIGSAVVDPITPIPATYLSLEVTVKPWNVNPNDLELN